MKRTVLAFVGLLAGAFANAADYRFTELAVFPGALPDAVGIAVAPSLNNNGQVVFHTDYFNEIWTAGNGLSQQVLYGFGTTRPNGDPLDLNRDVRINDNGTVAFSGGPTLESGGVYSGNGGALTEHVFTDNGSYSVEGITRSGTVAFRGAEVGGPSGVFTSAGGSVSIVPASASLAVVYRAYINDADRVIFSGYNLPMDIEGVYTDAGVTIADNTAGDFTTFFGGDVTWNSAGTAVFRARGGDNETGLYLYDGSTTRRIAAGHAVASINEGGDIAFATQDALFAGLGVDTETLVAIGGALDGRIVESILFGRDGLNDRGDLAFTVIFENGDQSVYLASPVPVPAALWLFAPALLLFPAAGRRRQPR